LSIGFSTICQEMEHDFLPLDEILGTALQDLSPQGYIDSRSGLTRRSIVSQHGPETGTMERMTPLNELKNVE